MKKINSIKLFTLLFTIGLFHCCTIKEEGIANATPSPSEMKITNGILILPNHKVLTSILNDKIEISTNNFVTKFTSQQNLLDEIIAAERKQMDYLDQLSGKALEQAPKHSNTYNEALRKGVIRKVFYTDGSSSYDLNLAAPYYAKVVNNKGFFAVNDTIFQVTANQFKIWFQGDIQNTKLLSECKISDPKKNILVYDYTSKPQARTISFPASPPNITSGLSIIKDNKRYSFVYYDKMALALPDNYIRELYMRAIGQEKINGTNSYNFKSFAFKIGIKLTTETNGVRSNEIILYSFNTGSNVWFTIYPSYNLFLDGKNPVTTNEPYTYILTAYPYLELTDPVAFSMLGFTRSSISDVFFRNIERGTTSTYEVKDFTEIPN